MPPLPLPALAVISIQLTSLAAVQPQPLPVDTSTLPLLDAESAVALEAESVRLAGEPPCWMATVGGFGKPVWIVIRPLPGHAAVGANGVIDCAAGGAVCAVRQLYPTLIGGRGLPGAVGRHLKRARSPTYRIVRRCGGNRKVASSAGLCNHHDDAGNRHGALSIRANGIRVRGPTHRTHAKARGARRDVQPSDPGAHRRAP